MLVNNKGEDVCLCSAVSRPLGHSKRTKLLMLDIKSEFYQTSCECMCVI